ncbi:hypothetical protein [Pseudonocardia sp. NPDC049154]|uniref:hypothetical protein n=1 Tax=Pseudonocardia sp. NPDC049154 TaxID=3155501 RepID=UPI0033CB6E31
MLLVGELGELVVQPEDLRFGDGGGLERDESGDPERETNGVDAAGAVEWVKSGVGNAGGAADVVQPRRDDGVITVLDYGESAASAGDRPQCLGRRRGAIHLAAGRWAERYRKWRATPGRGARQPGVVKSPHATRARPLFAAP